MADPALALGSRNVQYELPPLPYADNALEPHLSADAVRRHRDKHWAGYIKKLNEFSEVKSAQDGTPIEQFIIRGANMKKPKPNGWLPPGAISTPLFNMAAQVYNHGFFAHSLSPKGGGEPDGEILRGIRQQYDTVASFKELVKRAGMDLFGSGWVWIVLDGDRLEIKRGPNASTPLAYGMVPLLTIDVWEHAYYADYKSNREGYLDAVLDHLINWKFANDNLSHTVEEEEG